MNKLITSAGLAALGVASLQAAYAPGMSSQERTKPWNVSAVLRGFYDDNIATSPRATRQDSFGFEFAPSAGFNIITDQTTLGLSYLYSMRWFEARESDRADHSHQFNGKVSHAFTERFKGDLSDSFVIAQEPTIIDPTAVLATPLRSEGDNMRNTLNASFSAGITENLDAVVGYNNNYFDYEAEGVGSRSALLDRVEHLASLNLRYRILPKTIGIVGYQYGVTDYNSPDAIGIGFGPGSADLRDKTSHFGYVGVDQGITPTLNIAVRGGVEHTIFENADRLPGLLPEDETSPYLDANTTWTYTKGSYAQLGLKHARSSTDVGSLFGNAPTLDAQATTLYGSVNHRITARLIGSLIAQYQHSEFEAGLADSFADDFFLAGLVFTYEINKFLSAEASYNYDHLDSELDGLGVPRSFTRNRVFLGIRANY